MRTELYKIKELKEHYQLDTLRRALRNYVSELGVLSTAKLLVELTDHPFLYAENARKELGR